MGSKIKIIGERNAHGQFKEKTWRDEKIAIKQGRSKVRLCACCKKDFPSTRSNNNAYCIVCAEFIKIVRWKHNQQIKRLRDRLSGFESLGTVGRIKQQLKWNKEAHTIIKNLKHKVTYYGCKNKSKRLL